MSTGRKRSKQRTSRAKRETLKEALDPPSHLHTRICHERLPSPLPPTDTQHFPVTDVVTRMAAEALAVVSVAGGGVMWCGYLRGGKEGGRWAKKREKEKYWGNWEGERETEGKAMRVKGRL